MRRTGLEVVVMAGAATPVAHLLEAGVAVVLVDPDADALGRVARGAGPDARLAIFVGDPREGAVMAAAELMGRELFGRIE
jgi:ABC-type sugar transport system substrate-binding protein